MFKGIVIEESLSDRSVLDSVKIIHTEVEQVIESHHTPWLKLWTLHTVEVSDDLVEAFSESLSHSLLSKPGTWYADFRDATTHVIIFPGKVFKVDRSRPEDYEAAKKWGLAHGVPEHQLVWSPEVE